MSGELASEQAAEPVAGVIPTPFTSALDVFDRVRVISLPAREERRERVRREMLEVFGGDHWQTPHADIQFAKAVDGQLSPPPEWWYRRSPRHVGHGAWGCLHSHTRVVQDAARDGVETLLVLEDDACWLPDAAARLRKLMAEVPDDWDQIYLGGQHVRPPMETDREGVLRGIEVHRTHAYALRRKFFANYLEHVWHAPDYMARPQSHLDHQLGLLHTRLQHRIYAAEWHIAGQAGGQSDISGALEPPRWWHPATREHVEGLACVLVPVEEGAARRAELVGRLHFGRELPGQGAPVAKGLRGEVTLAQLRQHLGALALEGLELGKAVAVCHPLVTWEMLQEAWRGIPVRLELADADPEVLEVPW